MSSLPQLVDFFFPGFSMLASVVQKYLHVDLNLYIPLVLFAGMLTVCWNYVSQWYFWDQLETHFMSVVDIRTDDEIYNILMAWVASQRFSEGARRFVVNTNLSSRSWYLWRWDDDDDDDGIEGDDSRSPEKKKKKALSYTPSFGSHYFWFKGRLLLFRRTANREQNSYGMCRMLVSEKEEISISCFGRNPWVLKELLMEAQQKYMEKDECKTQIYRGTVRSMSNEAVWQRCMSRVSRPFSTVILNEETKQELIDDVSDYLCPATQRWYANRGIPYRRGYLLYGPPGTGKSSLSLALAGFFKMRIYIVSLSSNNANEETLGALFAELPRRCVVLLEDIDTAGLTHTRDDNGSSKQGENNETESKEGSRDNGGSTSSNNNNNNNNNNSGRLSLSGLLNILDGVASQEGRVLIMTTNHLEKLDKALIRPGRVDMMVEFGLADSYMTTNIFKNIFAYLEGDDGSDPLALANLRPDERDAAIKRKEETRAAHDANIDVLAREFAVRIPPHEFSPAELQGHLMRFKRDPEKAVGSSEEFVEKTRKEHKDKQFKAAEDRRKAEEEKKKEAQKKAEEEQKSIEDEGGKKAEEEIWKRVEEKIKKQFGDEIKKKVEEEIKKASAKSQKAAKCSTDTSESLSQSGSATATPAQSTPSDSEPRSDPVSVDIASKPSAGGNPASNDMPAITTLIQETEASTSLNKQGHRRMDSGYATPSSGEP
ncbi:BCS1 N terminal-domain-containing protein [Xylariaceae sp. FL1019]|nr:BCS1 N terminal-domain-containing protein [Xylariaceae sp. FL1019]